MTQIDAGVLTVPELVSVVMNQIPVDMREGLLALPVDAGLHVMAQLMEADVAAACGPRQARCRADSGAPWQIASEESALLANFGADYEAYRAVVPRWLGRRSVAFRSKV